MLPSINVGHNFFNCGITKEWVLHAILGSQDRRDRSLLVAGGVDRGSHVCLRWRC